MIEPRGLFVTDLDGTLFDEHGELPPSNLAAIERATAAGVALVIATGRRRSSFRAARPRLDGLGYRTSLSNGAVLLGADNERIERVREIAWDGVEAILERRHPLVRLVVTITVPDDTGTGEGSGEEEPDAIVWGRDGRVQFATLFGDPQTFRDADPAVVRTRRLVHLAMLTGSRDEGEALIPLARDCFGADVAVHTARSPRLDGTLTEVVPGGGKGNAVEDYARLLAVPLAATAGIGDELNDEALLAASRYRYAVGGSPLAERRRDATEVASAGEGAVADALGRFVAALDGD